MEWRNFEPHAPTLAWSCLQNRTKEKDILVKNSPPSIRMESGLDRILEIIALGIGNNWISKDKNRRHRSRITGKCFVLVFPVSALKNVNVVLVTNGKS